VDGVMDNSEHQRARNHSVFAIIDGRGCFVYTLDGESFAVFIDQEDAWNKPGVPIDLADARFLRVRSDVVLH
jgi:hypothetical protein